MVIDRLRDRLVTIVADFRSQTSLRTCCSNLLQKDCVLLAQVLWNCRIHPSSVSTFVIDAHTAE
jgi:hypothetical protein